ncbi:hypothetical protein AK812_SmicGene1083 [Symbiodinium microadriaticum]|uniref:Uncharacterized protein n=1 Tax=Symbiodinium microadriaticum TaxID=2951 RepID=A0A1Q9F504_SYMMI|nr:hypothetical protein AK812_SmicGene1083 [Symbiodinium microadriaticum]CAE7913441.1 unnamed protein product [Symbiodinium sp. KB8]
MLKNAFTVVALARCGPKDAMPGLKQSVMGRFARPFLAAQCSKGRETHGMRLCRTTRLRGGCSNSGRIGKPRATGHVEEISKLTSVEGLPDPVWRGAYLLEFDSDTVEYLNLQGANYYMLDDIGMHLFTSDSSVLQDEQTLEESPERGVADGDFVVIMTAKPKEEAAPPPPAAVPETAAASPAAPVVAPPVQPEAPPAPAVLPPDQATHDQYVGQLNAFLAEVAQSPCTFEKIVARRREWDSSGTLQRSEGGEDLPCVPDCITEAL